MDRVHLGLVQVNAPAKITFEYADGDVAVRKSFSFDHTYAVHVETSVMSKGSQVAAYPAWPAGFGDQSSLASYAASQINYQYNGNIERLAIKKVSGGSTPPPTVQLGWSHRSVFRGRVHPRRFAELRFGHAAQPTQRFPRIRKIRTRWIRLPVEMLGAAIGNPSGPDRRASVCWTESADDAGIGSGADHRRRRARPPRLINFGFWGVMRVRFSCGCVGPTTSSTTGAGRSAYKH